MQDLKTRILARAERQTDPRKAEVLKDLAGEAHTIRHG